MSIPASLAISKLRYPETEETLTTGRVVIPEDDKHKSANSLHAFANGAWLGLKIAGMILSTLLCIIALLGLANGLLTWWGRYLNINDPPLTVELIVGYICYPIAFLLGVPRNGGMHPFSLFLSPILLHEPPDVYLDRDHFPNCSGTIRLPESFDVSMKLTRRSCRPSESGPTYRHKARC